MFKSQILFSFLIIFCLSSQNAHAGITQSLLLTPYVKIQSVVQKISAGYTKLTSIQQKAEMKNLAPQKIIKKETTSDNSPLLTGEDVSLYTDETFQSALLAELKKDKPNVSKVHQIVKNTYLVDYGAKNSLSTRDRIDLDSDAVIKIDPMADAKRVNTQEFIQHKRYLSLHHGLAISEKILALMKKQDEELKNMGNNIKSRKDVKTLENGLAWLDKKISIILNELLVVESSLLEINSTLMMQDKQKQIVEKD